MGDDTSLTKLTVAVAAGNVAAAVVTTAIGAYLGKRYGPKILEGVTKGAAEGVAGGIDPLSLLTGGLSSGGGMEMGETGDIGTLGRDQPDDSGPHIDLSDMMEEAEDIADMMGEGLDDEDDAPDEQ